MDRRVWPWILFVGGMIALVAFAALREERVGAMERHGQESAPLATGGEMAPVLVELFTSEGCSSCPPADRLLTRLQQEQPVPGARIIAVGEHVDYWNRLGWADPFSSPEFSTRQQDYAAFFGIDGPYTPQMIVDGRAEFVGSDQARALKAVAQAAKLSKATVQVERKDRTTDLTSGSAVLRVRIVAPDRSTAKEPADVWLAITEDGLESAVERGENAGRRLRHVAVVRELRVIGKVDFRKVESFMAEPTITLRPEWKRERLNAVVFAQERRGRRILAAGQLAL